MATGSGRSLLYQLSHTPLDPFVEMTRFALNLYLTITGAIRAQTSQTKLIIDLTAFYCNCEGESLLLGEIRGKLAQDSISARGKPTHNLLANLTRGNPSL